MVRAHTLDLGCADIMERNSRFWSAASLYNIDFSRYVEVGWRHRNGTPAYETFAEWGILNPCCTRNHRLGPSIACCAWSVSKVFYLSSNAKWNFKFDYGNDGTWFDVTTPTAIGWTTGWPLSLTGICCNTQDPYDHFDDLMFTVDGAGTLASWIDNAEIFNDLPGRVYQWINNTDWENVAG